MVLTPNLGHGQVVQTLDVQIQQFIFVAINGNIKRQPLLKGIQIATSTLQKRHLASISYPRSYQTPHTNRGLVQYIVWEADLWNGWNGVDVFEL